MITLALVQNVDDNGVYVTMPGSKGVLRGPYKSLATVAAGTTVLVASTDDGEQVVVGPSPGGDGTVSVVAFGAKGDGVTDDTAAVQSAVNAAVGGALVFPSGTYNITDSIDVPAESRLVGEPGSQIAQQTAGTAGLRIVGSDVTIENLTLTGRHETSTYVDGEDAIQTDTTVDSPLQQLRVSGCTITGWGKYGIWMEHVNGLWIVDCTLDQIGYAGGCLCSCTQGQVTGNVVTNITAGTSGNSYGFIASRNTGADENPRSTDITFARNTLHNIRWEALDTHGGQRIIFAGNTITDCDRGIALVSSDDELGDQTFAPLECLVTGNTLDSLDDDGGRPAGIIVSGAVEGGVTVEHATGLIADNTVRRHGGTTTDGGIYLQHTRGFAVTGNVVEECNPCGVTLVASNDDALVASNVFIDVWSADYFSAAVDVIASSSCTVVGNVLLAGDKTATYLNDSGVYDFGGDAASNAVVAYANQFDAAATGAYVAGATPSSIASELGHTGGKVGFFGTAASAKPTITGSRGGNAALQSLLSALATLGLITDSSS